MKGDMRNGGTVYVRWGKNYAGIIFA